MCFPVCRLFVNVLEWVREREICAWVLNCIMCGIFWPVNRWCTLSLLVKICLFGDFSPPCIKIMSKWSKKCKMCEKGGKATPKCWLICKPWFSSLWKLLKTYFQQLPGWISKKVVFNITCLCWCQYEASTILHVRPEVRSTSTSTFWTTSTKLGHFVLSLEFNLKNS